MKPDLMKAAFGNRAEPSSHFHCGHIGHEQGLPVLVIAIGQGQRTWEAAGSPVDNAT